ncbi:MAG TPA: MFS transporter [Casimicrobiaceae bacterium]|nr:MFS transporter [Casimicrobiaceae bacterium]
MQDLIATRRDGATPAPSSPTTSAGGALAGLALATLLSSLGTSVANVGLPALADAFAAPFPHVQWVVLAYLLAITASIVVVGRLGDAAGRRRVLLAGIALFGVASLACGLAPSLGVLIAARAVQGVGAAVMMALAMAMVGETVPREKIGRAMGVLGTTSAVGTALGPSVGGLLIGGFGWRAMFLALVPLGVAALHLAYRFLPADRPRTPVDRPGFDPAGTVVLAITLTAYALAMTRGRGSLGPLDAALFLAAVAGAALFVRVEARVAAPLIRLATLRDPLLRASVATSALVSTVMMATLVVGPFYLARSLGLDAVLVGLVVSVGPVVVALAGVPAGRIVDRLGARRMGVAGLAGVTAGCTLLAALPVTLGIVGYVVPIVVVTAGYALFQTANNTAVMADVAPDQRGVISGLVSLSRNLGLVTGASAMGMVFGVASGAADVASASADAVATGMRATFAVAALLIAIALAIALASRAPASRRPASST